MLLRFSTSCRGFVLLTLAFSVTWWPSTATAQQLAVVSYTSEDGPLHPQVWSVLHDSRDYLWLGTSEGLSRWDGVEFLSFTAADGLPDLTVRNLLEDDQGRMWLGTDRGVAVYDGRTFTSYTGDEGPGEGSVWCSDQDARGRLWFGTQLGGVAVWAGTQFVNFGPESGLASIYVYSLMIDSQQRIWLGHRGAGLTQCTVAEPLGLTDCRTFTTADGLAHDEVRALVEDESGRVWIGTRGGGISRWDGNGFTTFDSTHGLASNDIYALLINDRKQLVIGTVRHGLTVCELPDLHGCRSYGMRNGFADDGVLTLELDHDGSLWAGLSNGLSHLWTESVESFTLTDGLPHQTVYAVHADPDGTVWVGTLDGIARISRPAADQEQARVTGWRSENVLPGYEVWDFCRDDRGRLWAATERGMCAFDNGRCRIVLTAADGLANSDLITIVPARDGSLWVGTVAGASHLVFDDLGEVETVFNLTTDDGLVGSYVNGIAEDPEGRIWLGTDRGLNLWVKGELLTYTEDDGLPVPEIMSILAEGDDKLWLGTNGGGLVGLTMGAQVPVFEVHGLEDGIPEVVSALIDAGDRNLWLGTGEGALLYNPETREVLERVDVTSGLPGSEVDVFRLDSSGDLWIGSSGGATRVILGHDRRPSTPPRVAIERARTLAGEEWRGAFTAPSANRNPDVAWFDTSLMNLDHDVAAIRFEFRALVFGPQQIRYQARLQGFDRDWSPAFAEPFKEYTNLDPGLYTLHVRAACLASEWSEPATLAFEVIPAWWQTRLARGGSLAALILLVVLAVRHRLTRIERRTEELERAVAERTDDLRRYARALEEHSRALDQANVRIRHADRVKSEFLANMSHELRTPLNSIIGFSEVLAQRLVDTLNEMELRFLNNVSRSGRYLLLLINNLLDLSKIEADRMDLHLETVDLAEVVEDTLRVVQGYASDRSVTIELQLAPEVGEVEVDVAKLNQILINLLSNAVKFSHKGGQVSVEVRSLTAAASDLDVASYELAITDRGPGIRDEDSEVIFEVFRQGGAGAERPGGTGLGLALVQRFVILLSGKVSFNSKPDLRTTFRVQLPRHPSAHRTESINVSAHGQDQGALARPCVLVVESQREHFAALAHAMEARGLLPVRAGDPDEARRMTHGLRPAALVLRWDGRAADLWAELSELCAQPHGLPVVAVARIGQTGPAAISADLSLLHSARPAQVAAAAQGLALEHGALVRICGSGEAAAERMISALEEEGLAAVRHDGPSREMGATGLVVLDFNNPDPESTLAQAATVPAGVRRIILLPPRIPPGFELLDGSAGPPVDQVAKEVRELLDRQLSISASSPSPPDHHG